MPTKTDIVIFGTGSFAARILLDLAATAGVPSRITIAGRNPDRLQWLVTAANARAHMFRRPAVIDGAGADPGDPDQAGELLAGARPAVIVQAASLQSASVIAAKNTAWARLVAEGGLSASTVFQSVITARVARAASKAAPDAHVINCCFPDVVNGLIAAAGLPITSGIGNIQILAHAFGGVLGAEGARDMRLLATYQNLADWRRPARERKGPAARVWLSGQEQDDVLARFRAVQLTPEPVIDISGAAGVPLVLALAQRRDWQGHAPGPRGLPGGYPVQVAGGRLALDLPPGLSEEGAIGWNAAFEEASGLVVGKDGHARYTGRLRDALAAVSPETAKGFPVAALEEAAREMAALRQRLS